MDRPDPTQRRIASQVKLARLRDSKQISAVVFNQSMKINQYEKPGTDDCALLPRDFLFDLHIFASRITAH
jgi:hypothetical protein